MIKDYKGYSAKVTIDQDQGLLHGEVVGIVDVVTFQGTTVEELTRAFHDSVDDYLAYCRERGKKPEKPYSGRFVLRVPPELHRRIALAARKSGLSMNEWVTAVLDAASQKEYGRPITDSATPRETAGGLLPIEQARVHKPAGGTGEDFTTQEAAQILGISTQGLGVLVKEGFVKPSKTLPAEGDKWRWSFRDLCVLRIFLEWRKAGADLIAIAKAVQYLQKGGLEDVDRRPFLLVSGAQVWAIEEPLAPMVCDLRPGLKEMRNIAAKVRAGRKSRKGRAKKKHEESVA